MIQKLVVPQEYAAAYKLIANDLRTFNRLRLTFLALAQIDQTVYGLFELTDKEKTPIKTWLASFPLNQL
jgi:hypothetical protein